jgi:iron complex transport system ATP-binding protein
MNKTTTLSLSNLDIGYTKENPLIESINIEANQGDLIALMGLNGSGKTTLFKTILGETPSIRGEIEVGNSSHEIHKNISVVFTERIDIYGFTVADMIAQGRAAHTNIFGKLTNHDKEVIQEQLTALSLEEIATQQINSLSDGQFQKVMIARALAQETQVLLLDEPTAFLDVKNKRMIHDLLHSLASSGNKTILVSTHDVLFCNSYCSKSWVIDNKRLKEKNPKEITELFFD